MALPDGALALALALARDGTLYQAAPIHAGQRCDQGLFF